MDLGPGKLGIGVDAGIMQKSLDGSKFIATQAGDVSIPTGNIGAMVPDVGAGLYFNTNDNKFYIGFSSLHLIGGTFKYANVQTTLARHYYVMTGYNHDINPSLTLKPSILIKSDAASTVVDLNCNLMYNNQIWGGLSYRHAPNFIQSDAAIVLLGMDLSTYVPGLRFGYSYDITTSDIRGYSSGSHEIMLGYCIKPKPKPTQSGRTVRFL
jgi:type IX secretion system PorP/SprF family membrane protein